MASIKKLYNFKFQLLFLSVVGLVSTFWQTAEKIHFLKNPDSTLSCNINPIVDCGVILNHELSSLFGVPNSMLGMVAFAILVSSAAMLIFGARITKKIALFVTVVVSAMMAFSIWFYIVSLFVIGKVCIFCVAIWIAVIPLFFLTLKEFDEYLFAKKSTLTKIRNALANKPQQFILLTYVVAVMVFLYQFRDYYF